MEKQSMYSEPAKRIKVIVVGESYVGKSTLLVRYVHRIFEPQNMTIGLDYRFKKVLYKDRLYKFELWDTAGQERFRTIVSNYFNQSRCGIVVFDLVRPQTLQKTKYWLNLLNANCGSILKVLVGTKADLLNTIEVNQQISEYLDKINNQIKQIEIQYNCKYFQVSAKSGEGIQQTFDYVINTLLRQQQQLNLKPSKPKPQRLSLFSQPDSPKKSKSSHKSVCCNSH